MYFHIGDNDCVIDSDVIGVFDVRALRDSAVAAAYIEAAGERGGVRVNSEEAKALVVLGDGSDSEAELVFSVVGTATLARRSNLY